MESRETSGFEAMVAGMTLHSGHWKYFNEQATPSAAREEEKESPDPANTTTFHHFSFFACELQIMI